MNISDIKDKSKTLLSIWRERNPLDSSLTIQLNEDTRIYIEQNRYSYIYVIPKSSGDIVLAVKFRVPESYTIAQSASIATALQELARNPLAVCSVINEFIKPGSSAESENKELGSIWDDVHPVDLCEVVSCMASELTDNYENEEPVPPTVRTGHSHGE